MGVPYTTRERVKLAVDVRDSVRANAQIDRLTLVASRNVDTLCKRQFTPRLGTIRIDHPGPNSPTSWRLWLDGDQELISLDSITAGGAMVSTATVLLYPTAGPPFNRIEMDRSGSGAFDSGSTPQRSVVAHGWLGFTDAQDPAGALAEDLDATETGIDVGATSVLGVGSLITCGDERMVVTGRTALDTGINLAGNLTADMNSVVVPLSTTVGAPTSGEMIIVDGETMLVTRIVGTNAVVVRGYDGSVLAAHTNGADIYAERTLTVRRGAVGTTAAAHASGAALTVWQPPHPVEALTIAETLNLMAQEHSAYARVVGSGEFLRESRGAGLKDLRKQVLDGFGRNGRTGAV